MASEATYQSWVWVVVSIVVAGVAEALEVRMRRVERANENESLRGAIFARRCGFDFDDE